MRRVEQQTSDEFARNFVNFLPTDYGSLGGMGAHMTSLLHVARQLKSSPVDTIPEKWLLWGGAGQIAELLAKVFSIV